MCRSTSAECSLKIKVLWVFESQTTSVRDDSEQIQAVTWWWSSPASSVPSKQLVEVRTSSNQVRVMVTIFTMRVAGQEVVAVSRSNQSSSMQTAEVYIQVQRLRRLNPVFLQIALQFRLEHTVLICKMNIVISSTFLIATICDWHLSILLPVISDWWSVVRSSPDSVLNVWDKTMILTFNKQYFMIPYSMVSE